MHKSVAALLVSALAACGATEPPAGAAPVAVPALPDPVLIALSGPNMPTQAMPFAGTLFVDSAGCFALAQDGGGTVRLIWPYGAERVQGSEGWGVRWRGARFVSGSPVRGSGTYVSGRAPPPHPTRKDLCLAASTLHMDGAVLGDGSQP